MNRSLATAFISGCWCAFLASATFVHGQEPEAFHFFGMDSGKKLLDVELEPGLPVDFDLVESLTGLGLDQSALVCQGRLRYGDPRLAPMAVGVIRKDARLRLVIDRNRDRQFQIEESLESAGESPLIWSTELTAASFEASEISSDREVSKRLEESSATAVGSAETDPIYPVRFRLEEASSQLFVATAGSMGGRIRFGDRDCEARYEDRNANGQWFDAEDRLFVDLNGDGKINMISERLQCQGMRTIAGTLYAIAGDPRGRTLAITPVLKKGRVVPRLELVNDEAAVVLIRGSIASESGINIPIDRLNEPLEVPIGRWYVQNLHVEVKDGERHYEFEFKRFGGKSRIEVPEHETLDFELLGELKLTASATQVADTSRGGKISILPLLSSESGCYLTNAKVGKNSASSENRLSSTSRFSNIATVLGSSGFS